MKNSTQMKIIVMHKIWQKKRRQWQKKKNFIFQYVQYPIFVPKTIQIASMIKKIKNEQPCESNCMQVSYIKIDQLKARKK